MLISCAFVLIVVLFFFNDTATTEIYTLSLHDALPILEHLMDEGDGDRSFADGRGHALDRKSTRLNSSHTVISYAVFCLKKKMDPLSAPRGAVIARWRDQLHLHDPQHARARNELDAHSR